MAKMFKAGVAFIPKKFNFPNSSLLKPGAIKPGAIKIGAIKPSAIKPGASIKKGAIKIGAIKPKAGTIVKGAAVSAAVVAASVNYSEKKKENEKLVVDCKNACMPYHKNIEEEVALPIILSAENYNNNSLNEWHYPERTEFNGPGCEKNYAMCKNQRDCVPGDTRASCKVNSLETFNRCAEECERMCRKCYPDPKPVETTLESLADVRDGLADGMGDIFGDIFGEIFGEFGEIFILFFLFCGGMLLFFAFKKKN
tara:strand:+ start:716 stop:1477 length:762 start_codon:yes stop_codon:yes gene_type:complete